MKKTLLYTISIVILIFIILISRYYYYKKIEDSIKIFNLEFERYLNNEILGNDIATIINKSIDYNKKNNLTKNDEKYINIDIDIIDLNEKEKYNMNVFYENGIMKFSQYYGRINFKCIEIRYGKDKRVNYMLFEQVTK